MAEHVNEFFKVSTPGNACYGQFALNTTQIPHFMTGTKNLLIKAKKK